MTQPTPGLCECASKENGFGYIEIHYCPLHAQAPALRAALANLLAYNDQRRLSELKACLLHESDSEAAARALLTEVQP